MFETLFTPRFIVVIKYALLFSNRTTTISPKQVENILKNIL